MIPSCLYNQWQVQPSLGSPLNDIRLQSPVKGNMEQSIPIPSMYSAFGYPFLTQTRSSPLSWELVP